MTTTEIMAQIPVWLGLLASLIIAIIGAYHGVAAKVKADANERSITANATTASTAHTANTSAIAAVAQNVHDIAVAMPAAIQQVTPQLQAIAQVPQVAAMVSAAAPTLQKINEVLTAVQAVSDQVKQATSSPPTQQAPKPLGSAGQTMT